MKMSSDTDMYQTKTFRKFGQMGKHVQHKNPMMRPVVMRFLFVISPSYIQVKYADSSKSRTRATCTLFLTDGQDEKVRLLSAAKSTFITEQSFHMCKM